MKKRSEFYGVEFDWFATDSHGFVALMSSAGYGQIPDSVFERLQEQEHIGAHLSQLIGYSTSGDLIRAKRLLSKVGVFTYDWKHWKGPYRRLGFPLLPRRIDTFGFAPELREAFVSLPKQFWFSWRLRPENLLPCTS